VADIIPLELRRIVEFLNDQMGTRDIIFGTGKENGSVYPAFKPGGVSINPVYLSSDGKFWVQFGSLENKPVFAPIEARRELMQRFNAIDNVNFTDADLTKYPSIPLTTIAHDPHGLNKMLTALTWMEQQIEQTT
jgi:hypothetical protein